MIVALSRLRTDRRGVAMLEFGLIAPLFISMTLTMIEMSNYVLANNRIQRLSSMTADLVAQSSTGNTGATEAQIYDLFSAVDLTARPYDVRRYGRVVITGIRGTDADNNNIIENKILWQRFDGDFIAVPVVGCHTTSPYAALPNGRVLPKDEILFHVQVSFRYQPIFTDMPLRLFDAPTQFTRTTMYRARSKDFQTPTPVAKFPPKQNCASTNGL